MRNIVAICFCIICIVIIGASLARVQQGDRENVLTLYKETGPLDFMGCKDKTAVDSLSFQLAKYQGKGFEQTWGVYASLGECGFFKNAILTPIRVAYVDMNFHDNREKALASNTAVKFVEFSTNGIRGFYMLTNWPIRIPPQSH